MVKPVRYDEKSIKAHLEDVNKIRSAPQVYCGTPDNNARLLIVKEPIQNSFDELILPENKTKTVVVVLDGEAVWIADSGRGVPVGINPDSKISTLTTVLTVLSAGAKGKGGGGYSKATAGIHGMGVTITNAMSTELIAWTYRDKQWHTQSFEKGKPVSKVGKSKAPKLPLIDNKLQPKQGTVIKFEADPSVFNKGAKLEVKTLEEFLDISAYLLPGIKIHLVTAKKHKEYYQPKGLVAYLDKQLAHLSATPLGKVFQHSSDNLDLALCWCDQSEERISSFVNGVPTPEHGTHVNGLNQALMDVLNPFKLKKHEFRSEDLRDGLVAVFNVQVKQPQFTTQNKIKLATPEATELVKKELTKTLAKFFAAHKSLARQIIDRAHALAEAKAEFKLNKKAITQLKVNKKGKTFLPPKLLVSTTKDPKRRELFVVEGDAAAGHCPKARNGEYQEVLPLRGKPLNVIQAKPDKIFANEEIKSLLTAIGYDPSKKDEGRRIQGRIILLCDADEDGKHIEVLTTAIVYKMFRSFIEEGNLYTVDASLFTTQIGTKRFYGATRKELLNSVPEKQRSRANVTRLKGWGEADHALLKEVAFDPKTRKLKRITMANNKGVQKFLSVIGSDTSFRKELLGL